VKAHNGIEGNNEPLFPLAGNLNTIMYFLGCRKIQNPGCLPFTWSVCRASPALCCWAVRC